MKETNKDVKYPCKGCKYFVVCGDNQRTHKCEGRDINKKGEKK